MSSAINNLEKLTEDLYQKLIEDAQKEIEQLNHQAKAEREKLLQEAQAKADAHIKEAERSAKLIKERGLQELRQGGLQIKNSLQSDLEHFLQEEIIRRPLQESFKDEEFVKDLLRSLLSNFDPKTYRVQWPAAWEEKWLSRIRQALPDWQFEINPANKLQLRDSEKGLEFHLDPEAFEQLLKTYFDDNLRKLIFNHE